MMNRGIQIMNNGKDIFYGQIIQVVDVQLSLYFLLRALEGNQFIKARNVDTVSIWKTDLICAEKYRTTKTTNITKNLVNIFTAAATLIFKELSTSAKIFTQFHQTL